MGITYYYFIRMEVVLERYSAEMFGVMKVKEAVSLFLSKLFLDVSLKEISGPTYTFQNFIITFGRIKDIIEKIHFNVDCKRDYVGQTSFAQLLSTCIVRPLVPQAHHCCRNRTRTKNRHSANFPLST